MVSIYGLKSCDTCRKALKALPSAELVDVRSEGVPKAIMEAVIAQFPDLVVNKKSTTWRQLSPEEREAPAAHLLEEHPTLMKRPLIVEGDKMTLGWTADVEAAWT